MRLRPCKSAPAISRGRQGRRLPAAQPCTLPWRSSLRRLAAREGGEEELGQVVCGAAGGRLVAEGIVCVIQLEVYGVLYFEVCVYFVVFFTHYMVLYTGEVYTWK